MQGIHGGDVYRNQVRLDFSININPLGMPGAVKGALKKAIHSCSQYPDLQSEALKHEVSKMLCVPEDNLLFGNGASELFLGIVHALRPKRTVIPVPSFYGYEYAAGAAGGDVLFCRMPSEENWKEALTEETGLLFLANPNNPTGALLDRAVLEEILELCTVKDIYVVLDECFVEFCHGGASMVSMAEKYDHLLLVRAFTKIFAIPGVRLGYIVCSNGALLNRIREQLPEWNVSVLAQQAGAVCAHQWAYIERTVKYVEKERAFLGARLKELGIRVVSGEANFLLVYSEEPLYEKLLQRGILIRDCSNFRGLSKGYYRIAVKQRKDNQKLLKVLGECVGQDRIITAGRN